MKNLNFKCIGKKLKGNIPKYMTIMNAKVVGSLEVTFLHYCISKFIEKKYITYTFIIRKSNRGVA